MPELTDDDIRQIERCSLAFRKHSHARFAYDFEQRTGKCPECYGSGQVVDHVHAIRSRGQHEQWVCRKPCPRCRRKVECHA